MFTGIVTAIGTVAAVTAHGGGLRLAVAPGALDCSDVAVGDSIAVDGVCLTVVDRGGGLAFDVSPETLACTTLGEAASGTRVNLEKALLPSTRLSGHLVSGHVDGVGTVTGRRAEGQIVRLDVELPPGLERYSAYKGSLCVNGVSLTVNGVAGRTAALGLIPHTLAQTNLVELQPGVRVNIEVDLIARYLERLLDTMRPGT